MEALLLGMEGRLANKIEATNTRVEKALEMATETNRALENLEHKVAATDDKLGTIEQRIGDRLENKVKDLVTKHLVEAGFDPELSVGDLTAARSTLSSYAAVTMSGPPAGGLATDQTKKTTSKAERDEERFWEGRRALRLWPLNDGRASLNDFLVKNLKMDGSFVEEELGEVTIKPCRDSRSRAKKEMIVIFESKQVRDEIKAHAHNLASGRGAGEEAGMRLHVPDHLQRDFKVLMNLAYDMKRNNPSLRRNVKFDEESLGLFMDIQTREDGDWKRIRPEQARKTVRNRSRPGPVEMDETDIQSVLGETGSGSGREGSEERSRI